MDTFWVNVTSELNQAFPEWRPQFDPAKVEYLCTSTAAISQYAFDGTGWGNIAPAIDAFIKDQAVSSNPPRDPMRALRAFLCKFFQGGTTLTAHRADLRDESAAWTAAAKTTATEPPPEWAQRRRLAQATQLPTGSAP